MPFGGFPAQAFSAFIAQRKLADPAGSVVQPPPANAPRLSSSFGAFNVNSKLLVYALAGAVLFSVAGIGKAKGRFLRGAMIGAGVAFAAPFVGISLPSLPAGN